MTKVLFNDKKFKCFKMMPMAPTSIMAIQSKPKIGFSIDSIVGSRITANKSQSPPYFSPNSEGSERPSSPLSDCSYPSDFNNSHYRSPKVATSPSEVQQHLRLKNNYSPKHQQQPRNDRSSLSPPPPANTRPNNHLNSSDHNNVRNSTPVQTRLSPESNNHQRPLSRSPSPIQRIENKGPIMVPGIPANGVVRPFPVPPHGMSDIKQLPPYMNTQEMLSAAHNQHMIAAQFQAAAALAHAHAGQGFGHGGMPPHPGHMHNPNMARDSYPLYPWLLSRHGRLFPHRFPGSEYIFRLIFQTNQMIFE
jgi:homeobox protein EMX